MVLFVVPTQSINAVDLRELGKLVDLRGGVRGKIE
jgi:hypothetical protein